MRTIAAVVKSIATRTADPAKRNGFTQGTIPEGKFQLAHVDGQLLEDLRELAERSPELLDDLEPAEPPAGDRPSADAPAADDAKAKKK